MTKEFLTVDELAERMKVRRRTVLAWVKAKIIPVIRPSPKVMRFDPNEVAEALTNAPVKSGSNHA